MLAFAQLRRQLPRLLAAAALTLLLPACASVSVEKRGADATRGVAKPRLIGVQPFEVKGALVKENFARQNPGQLGAEAQRLVMNYLVAELGKMGLQATAGNRGDWVIGGRFTRLQEGSRILRMGLGLGFGGTKMETQVEVRAAGGRKVLQFATSGGSNATPGAATNPIPFSAAPTALLASKEGVTDDAARTARMIAATIGEYMVKQGWLQPSQVPRKPKMKHGGA